MNTRSRFSCCSFRPTFILALAFATTVACVDARADKPDNGKGKGNGKGHAKGQSDNFIPPGHRRAPVEIVVKQAPPALRVEVAPARPSASHIWVPGFWNWEVSTYVWTPAVWSLPPAPAAVWVAPRYEPRASLSVYITGYWKL